MHLYGVTYEKLNLLIQMLGIIVNTSNKNIVAFGLKSSFEFCVINMYVNDVGKKKELEILSHTNKKERKG